jgi:hypothetical protein
MLFIRHRGDNGAPSQDLLSKPQTLGWGVYVPLHCILNCLSECPLCPFRASVVVPYSHVVHQMMMQGALPSGRNIHSCRNIRSGRNTRQPLASRLSPHILSGFGKAIQNTCPLSNSCSSLSGPSHRMQCFVGVGKLTRNRSKETPLILDYGETWGFE